MTEEHFDPRAPLSTAVLVAILGVGIILMFLVVPYILKALLPKRTMTFVGSVSAIKLFTLYLIV